MSMTDPIADMLTRIRNAVGAEKDSVEFPASRIKVEMLKIMKKEGFIKNFTVKSRGPKKTVKVALKYQGPAGASTITHLERISRPGRRRYVGVDEIPRVLGGMGLCLVSTSEGVMSGKSARKRGTGGEVICTIW